MTSAKVAVSLPKELLSRARRAVRGGAAASLSAYVSQALQRTLDEGDLTTMFHEMFTETGGPPTQAEINWADKALAIKRARKSSGEPRR